MIFQDLKANKRNLKSIFILILFRLSNIFATNNIFIIRLIGLPIRIFYKIFIEWIMTVEIPEKTKIGKNCKLYHGQGLVINPKCIIGQGVTLRHNTTIGNSKAGGGCPKIGDFVNIGSNSVIIGDIIIGNNVVIGAGSVVITDVPNNAIVAGVPAKIIKYQENSNE
jgi:serine acetyltransferase